ncbi:MAG: CHRD domain-containing protein [Balneolaceae bacterium]
MKKRTGLLLLSMFLVQIPALYAQRSAEVNLAGFHQTPPVRTAGMGFLLVELRGDSLTVSGEFHDLSNAYRSAYIQYGAPGKNGHRLFKLNSISGDDLQSGTFESDENQFKLTESQRDAISKGLLYINIASDRYRLGEIRGQIPAM